MPDHDTTRDELLTRYRAYRQAIQQHLNAALKYLSDSAIKTAAQRIGLLSSGAIAAEHFSEMSLVYDLAVFGEKLGRSRAIDRYARAARFPEGSAEATTLAAMQANTFHVLLARRRHEIAGTIVDDIVRNRELWLLDEGLEQTFNEGQTLAARLIRLGDIHTTVGAIVPIGKDIMADALSSRRSWRENPNQLAANDSRLPEAIYAAAIAHHSMQYMAYSDDD